MSSQQQLHFIRDPYPCARVIAQLQEQKQRKFTIIVVYTLVSAIIVLSMAYLPTLTASILTGLNIVPAHLSSASDGVNRANKDDRLRSVRFEDRWNALTTRIQTLGNNGGHAHVTDPAKDVRRIPIGCEPAFSHLIETGNFSVRCVSSADIPTLLADVE